MNRQSTCVVAVLGPALLGLACAYLAAGYFEFYGWTIFLGIPLLVSFGSSLLYRRFIDASWGKTYGVAVLSLITLGGLIVLFALDGLICLLMALPLALLIALPGSAAGFLLAQRWVSSRAALLNMVLFGLLALLMGFEQHAPGTAPSHRVVSAVTVHAPIAKVWNGVVAFDRILAPPRGIFRMGIAYPIEAKIDGSGVGAIRHCVFSTGAFVEPITEWSEPHTLAFDVIENPPPMKELSIYSALDAPHLHGIFTATKGQFRLRQAGNTTLLEGTTWYTQKLYPDWYWHHVSDRIIHRIHMRVLEHIKNEAEGKPLQPTPERAR